MKSPVKFFEIASFVELGEQRAESRERRAESRVLIKFVVIFMAVMTVAITASEIMAAAAVGITATASEIIAAAAVGITANESVAVAAVKLDRSGQGRYGRSRGFSRPVRRPRP